ncbi:uncharacterized protein CDAR_108201 [Caerostris darwini]|uniref:Uncharacterized protein n=1 Tax=Caerostris darwini TaxID=1538125 RepID=A0AAV4X2X0_9ARAC|nr:uncharacterized protein CDAR_108201 [Caerostris darwini]
MNEAECKRPSWKNTIYAPRQTREELTEEKGKSKKLWNCRIAWTIFKGLIFIACMTCFLRQSVEFYWYYYTYPTTTTTKIVNPKSYRLPAVTICNQYPKRIKDFCAEHPNLCQSPTDVELFCEEYPHFCHEINASDLVDYNDAGVSIKFRQHWNMLERVSASFLTLRFDLIPKIGLYSNYSEEAMELAGKYLKNFTDDDSPLFGWSGSEIKTTLTHFPNMGNIQFLSKCYSANLHLESSDEPTCERFDIPCEQGGSIFQKALTLYFIKLRLHPEDAFLPWDENQMIFIHSPFVPISQFEVNFIKPKVDYIINIKMEEEHLLPHPYQTNCTDYEALWLKNNKTGPRSKEMCIELCGIAASKNYSTCEFSRTMHETADSMCNSDPFLILCPKFEMQKKIRRQCEALCNSECVSETRIVLFLKDPDVTILKHIPLYGNGELFSFIGGLMGCWLGISVWALTDIIERTLFKVVKLVARDTSRQPVESNL